MSDDLPEEEQDEKPEEKFDDPLQKKPARGPIIWAFLLFVPIILTFTVTLLKEPEPEIKLEVQTAEQAQAVTEPSSSKSTVPAETRRVGQLIRQKEKSCDYKHWHGARFGDEVKRKLTNSKKPYRVLLPGQSYTQDYSPSRMNVQLDENGVITRVWCG